MKRRTFLGLATSGFVISLGLGAKLGGLGTRIAGYRTPRLDEKYPTGSLSEAEMNTAIALAEVLIPSDRQSEQVVNVLSSHVDERTSHDRGYLKEYRKAVALLDETTGHVIASDRKFSELTVSDRQRIVETILWKYQSEQTRTRQIEEIFSPDRNLAFRKFIVADILEAFFRKTPAEGWAIVGYAHYPGVPADPRAYSSLWR